MNVLLNGHPADLPDGATVAAVLDQLDVPAGGRGVAVAVDAEVIPRGSWGQTPLYEGAQIEVVHAVQGG